MFPRYCFVRPGHEGQAIGPIRSTPGVTTLVRFGTIIASLRVDKLDALRQLLDEQAAALPGQPFEPGSNVVFHSGPLKGASGIVSHIADERVTVLMSLLGRDQRVTTTVASLACADSAG
jgi:transcriptional antiterminator RfaH